MLVISAVISCIYHLAGQFVLSKNNDHVTFLFSFDGEAKAAGATTTLPSPFLLHNGHCRISRDVKERAIALFRDMDLKSIAHVLDVSTHSISRWIFNVSIYGDVGPPKSPLKGRPRVCKSSTLDRLTKFLLKNPTVYLDEVQFWLSVEEVILISISTIHRYQKYVLGFTNKCVTGSAIERNNKERVHWYDEAQGMLYDFQILCTDQSYIDDCTGTRQKGYAIRGEECFV